jgi:hypothetical protein
VGSFRLSPNKSKKVSIAFAPTTVGPFGGAITVTGGGTSAQVNVNGTGVSGTLTITSPSPLDFGTVKVHRKKTLLLTIEDTGLGVLHGNVDTSSGLAKPFSAKGSGRYALPDGKKRSAKVTFAPQAKGAFIGTITITSDDPANLSVAVEVKGSGD